MLKASSIGTEDDSLSVFDAGGREMSGQRGFFDIDERYAALSAAGDPLQRLASRSFG